jgi:antitoxin component of MazEF toxin-antitoxin module
MLMLKKLVKYGNSNALILDKAILELLEITEGSLLKIKTDGKCLIITPQGEHKQEQAISETITAQNALSDAYSKEYLKKYAHLPNDKRENIAKEIGTLHKDLMKYSLALALDTDYTKECETLRTEYYPNFLSAEFVNKVTALRYKYSPEIEKIEKELMHFDIKHGLNLNTQKDIETLYNDNVNAFALLFTKYASVRKKLNEVLESVDFQHESQLLAEQYENNKNSTDYIKAFTALKYKYVPEALEMDKEIQAVGMQ